MTQFNFKELLFIFAIFIATLLSSTNIYCQNKDEIKISGSDVYTYVKLKDSTMVNGSIIAVRENDFDIYSVSRGKRTILKSQVANIRVVRTIEENESTYQKTLKVTDSSQIVLLKLKDGTQISGKITAVRESEIDFESSMGKNTIPKNKIEEVINQAKANIHEGKYWFPNPNTTRLVFAPTGFMLKKGEGYFQDIYLFYIAANYGVTDNFSIGAMGMIPIIPTLYIGALTPKVGCEVSENVHIAAGAWLGFASFGGDWGIANGTATFGIVYGASTFGSSDLNVTLGGGYAYAQGEFSKDPAIVIGGTARVSKGFGFVTENYFTPTAIGSNGVLSGGVRFFGEKMTFDCGLLRPVVLGDIGIIGFPYASFVVKF